MQTGLGGGWGRMFFVDLFFVLHCGGEASGARALKLGGGWALSVLGGGWDSIFSLLNFISFSIL